MRVVNLARRPFVNRRLIVRFAVLLWLAGALLLVWNVRLYRGHWQGTAENRALLEEAERKLDAERRNRDRAARRLDDVDLGSQNRQATFLNSLIAYRTFPWSPLFDDLEEVLPAEVKLFNVQPVVRLATEAARDSRRAALREAAAERAAARRRGRTTGRRGTSSEPPAAAEGRTLARPEPEEPQLAPDEVALRLNGLAKSEEALVELVDRLFANPSFRRPVLENESFDPNQRATVFSLFVVYLTHRPVLSEPAPLVADEGLAEDVPAGAGGDESVGPGTETETETETELAEGTETAESEMPPQTARAESGAPVAAPSRGSLDRGAPDRGALEPTMPRPGPASEAPAGEAPARGAPTPGVPSPGGFQTLAAGTPTAGAPSSGTQEGGAPGNGTPLAGDPEAETPAAGAPERAETESRPEESETADRSPPESETEDRMPGREGDSPGDDEPTLGERDASATPEIDRGGQVRLAPDFRHRGLPALTGALNLAEAAA